MARDEAVLPSAARAADSVTTLDFLTFNPGAVLFVEISAGTGTVAVTAQVKNPFTGTVDTSNIAGVSIAAFSGAGEVRRLVCFPGAGTVTDESASRSLAGGVRFTFTVGATNGATFSAYVRSIG